MGRPLRSVAGAFLGLALAVAPARAFDGAPIVDDFTVARATPVFEPLATAMTPAFAAADPTPPAAAAEEEAEDEDAVGGGRMERKKPRQPKDASAEPKVSRPARMGTVANALGGDRARILLQSLTVPGWGQATLGRKTSATVFALAEAGIWGTFAAFRVQQHLRRLSYENTAELYAGIDLDDRDEEFRRIVGSFPSSEDYNKFVVYRDAANLYLQPGEEDIAAYRAYIDAHALQGADTWAWASADSYERYQSQRKHTQRAGQRANTALAVAIGNRLLSAIHAARYARSPAAPRSWNLECVPAGNDPTAFHLGVRTRF